MALSFAVSEKDFKNLDTVEIKTTIADTEKDRIRELLPTHLSPQKSWVYFFDTVDLTLFNTHQVILRARKNILGTQKAEVLPKARQGQF